VNIFIFEETH